MTSQGTAHGRFTRPIQRRNLFPAEPAPREMGTPSLPVALDYLELLAEVRPEKVKVGRVRDAPLGAGALPSAPVTSGLDA